MSGEDFSDEDGKGTAGLELKRSWVVLLACSLGASVGAAAYPLFLVPVIGLRLEERFGWSRLDTSSLTSIAFIGGAIGVPIVGWLNDRWSSKLPIVAGMALIGVMLMLAAQTPASILAWQIGLFLFMLLGAATLSASFSKIVCTRFHAMRGLALGITIGSVSFVSAAALPWFTQLIDQIGIERFFFRAGIFYLVVMVPLTLALVPEVVPAKNAAAAQTHSAVDPKVPPYALWALGISGILLSTITGSAAHLAAVAADGGTVEPTLVGSVFAGGVLLSRPLGGFIIDHIDARRVGAVLAALAAAGLVITALFGDRYVLVGAVLLAAAVGAEFDVVALLASRYVASDRFGRIFGWMYAGMLVAAAIGPLFIALQLKLFGTYRLPFLSAACLAAMASLIMITLPSYSRNRSVP
jgi:MFS family permease